MLINSVYAWFMSNYHHVWRMLACPSENEWGTTKPQILKQNYHYHKKLFILPQCKNSWICNPLIQLFQYVDKMLNDKTLRIKTNWIENWKSFKFSLNIELKSSHSLQYPSNRIAGCVLKSIHYSPTNMFTIYFNSPCVGFHGPILPPGRAPHRPLETNKISPSLSPQEKLLWRELKTFPGSNYHPDPGCIWQNLNNSR